MQSLLTIIDIILNMYTWVVIISVVMTWLIAFNIINMSNNFVQQVSYILYKLTEPALSFIRRIVPTIGGIDLSPVVLILALYFLRLLMREYLF